MMGKTDQARLRNSTGISFQESCSDLTKYIGTNFVATEMTARRQIIS